MEAWVVRVCSVRVAWHAPLLHHHHPLLMRAPWSLLCLQGLQCCQGLRGGRRRPSASKCTRRRTRQRQRLTRPGADDIENASTPRLLLRSRLGVVCEP